MANNKTKDTQEIIEGMSLEGLKHYFEFFKHLTTINTGSILLLIAFLERLFKNPEWSALIGVSLIGFIVSLIACLVGMWLSSTLLAGEAGQGEVIAGSISWLVCVVGFISGIISLVIFAFKNFY